MHAVVQYMQYSVDVTSYPDLQVTSSFSDYSCESEKVRPISARARASRRVEKKSEGMSYPNQSTLLPLGMSFTTEYTVLFYDMASWLLGLVCSKLVFEAHAAIPACTPYG